MKVLVYCDLCYAGNVLVDVKKPEDIQKKLDAGDYEVINEDRSGGTAYVSWKDEPVFDEDGQIELDSRTLRPIVEKEAKKAKEAKRARKAKGGV